MSALSIGLSALQVNQRLLTLTGENVANANTPNYQRQVAELSARVAGGSIGMGVEITNITRLTNQTLQDAIRTNTNAASDSATQLQGLQHLQAYLAPGDGSLRDALDGFFSEAVKLTTDPTNLTQRRIVLNAANTIADRLNTTTENINQLRTSIASQAKSDVNAVNSLTGQIAELNQRIQEATASGQMTSELGDNRDQAIAKLSGLIDVKVTAGQLGQVNVQAGGALLVAGSTHTTLQTTIDARNQLIVFTAKTPLDIQGGNLAGEITLRNTVLPAVQGQLDALAQALRAQFDQIQARGLGLDGPLSAQSSSNQVASVTAPLSSANLQPAPTAGELAITVTNLSTGERTLTRLQVDPAMQSLSDVAAGISTVAHVQGVVDPQTGTLHILSQPGYGFDFTGNFSSKPDAQAIAGTTTASFAGRYTGAANDTLTYRFTSAGTIGATPNLGLEVRNSAGTLLTTLNVGVGYPPGTDLASVMGVNVQLGAGTVNAGDSFTLNVVNNADTAGLLPALGINSFFQGAAAGDLHVRPDLLDHPERLALSISGDAGDGSNLARLVALRDQPVLNNGTQSLTQAYDALLGDVGARVQDMQARNSARTSLGQQLDAEMQSLVGVDPNEEVVRLVQYQRAFQLSSRYISAVNDMLEQMYNLI